MKVLVTGAAGLLGSEVVPALAANHDVAPADLAEFDITLLDDTIRAVRDVGPDVIVHCAAWSDVDGAESDPDGAFRVNGIGTKNVVLAANEIGAGVLHISTDYVFDGRSDTPYVESDPVNPIGVYARSKWMAEQTVRELAADWTVVRTQALYGARGPSFVKAILARVKAGEPLRVVDDQTVCPTRAGDLAATIARLLDEGGPGIYHASTRGECTWFEFAAEIIAQAGAPDHPLDRMSSDELDRPAPRPAYSVLRNLHLELTIGDSMPGWQESLRAHFAASRP